MLPFEATRCQQETYKGHQLVLAAEPLGVCEAENDFKLFLLSWIHLRWQVAMTQPQMAPICLVENHNEQLSVNQEAIEILDKISQPVVVVAIVGLYRTGKSYLMNRLAGQNHGEWHAVYQPKV